MVMVMVFQCWCSCACLARRSYYCFSMLVELMYQWSVWISHTCKCCSPKWIFCVVFFLELSIEWLTFLVASFLFKIKNINILYLQLFKEWSWRTTLSLFFNYLLCLHLIEWNTLLLFKRKNVALLPIIIHIFSFIILFINIFLIKSEKIKYMIKFYHKILLYFKGYFNPYRSGINASVKSKFKIQSKVDALSEKSVRKTVPITRVSLWVYLKGSIAFIPIAELDTFLLS